MVAQNIENASLKSKGVRVFFNMNISQILMTEMSGKAHPELSRLRFLNKVPNTIFPLIVIKITNDIVHWSTA